MIMVGFGTGALAPVILGAVKQYASLSAGISTLGIIWLVAGIVMLVGSKIFYRKDFLKLQQNEK
jgi:hypothetical protein